MTFGVYNSPVNRRTALKGASEHEHFADEPAGNLDSKTSAIVKRISNRKKYLYRFDDCTCGCITICRCPLWGWSAAGNKKLFIFTSVKLGIITDHSEKLNSTVERKKICRIKFHMGVEFNSATK